MTHQSAPNPAANAGTMPALVHSVADLNSGPRAESRRPPRPRANQSSRGVPVKGNGVIGRRQLLGGGLGAALLTACGSRARTGAMAMPDTQEPPGPRWIGRVVETGDGRVSYGWSGCGFRARFRGTGLTVELADKENWHAVV